MRIRGLALALFVVACGATLPREEPPAAAANATESTNATGTALVTLATRNHLLRVWSGATGPRFAVEDRVGRVIARDLDAGMLARDWPALHDAWQTGVASEVHADVDVAGDFEGP